jgi:2-iminobutanoate/2-iminopropanoate deaminase
MARDIIRTPNAPSSTTYSQAVRAAGFVFVSGTGPQDPATGKIVGDTIQEQTRQCLQNVSAILEAAGSSLERVMSVTVTSVSCIAPNASRLPSGINSEP